ncbi:hypothetical protein [Bradyrhizobium sp. dw_78]|uniref:hypothetical protein n=1 Tax=Bradyrhizobium sp. dw_78 TaxID=2719793 RepID=UPI001BD1F80B|nr:hypothetical protein [Bradyrhizobium sp. dw_78]
MTIERPMFPPRGGSALRLVAGTDVRAGEAPDTPPPSRDKSEDPVFAAIERHRHALQSYNAAVEADSDTSGKRCDDMFLMSRVLILTRPTTRAGLIAFVRYLETQFDIEADCYGCMSIADKIGDQPWPQVLMRTLALSLRAMASKLPKAARVGGVTNVTKPLYSVARSAHSRKPRKSKNSAPEERAVKAAEPPAGPVPETSHGKIEAPEIQAARREIERLFLDLDPKLKPVALTWLRHLATEGSS